MDDVISILYKKTKKILNAENNFLLDMLILHGIINLCC